MESANERVGVLTVGMGAVATTFMAGIFATRRGLGEPIGSLSELGNLPDLENPANKQAIRDFLPVVPLSNFVFGGWDIFSDDAYEMARQAGVLEKELLQNVQADTDMRGSIANAGGRRS